jgi:AsmA protein
MKKTLKYLLIAVAALLVLALAVIAFVAATFNPNDYKPELVKLVKEQTGRTLAIPGTIQLTFFPRIGADLGQLSLSEPRSEQVFAAARQMQVSVALLPLFSRQVVVDRVVVDGLTLKLVRDRQGHYNFDDLLPKEAAAPGTAAPKTEAPATMPALDVGGIALTNASIDYRDEAAHRHVAVSNLSFSTGAIADGRKSELDFRAEVAGENPQLALKLAVASGFTPDLSQRKLRLDGLTASVNGRAASLRDLQLKLAVPAFEASPRALQAAALTLDAAVTLDGRALGTKLSTAVQGDLATQRYEFKGLRLEASAPNPAGGTLAFKAGGQATADLAQENARVALDGQLDSTTLALKAGVKNFAHPAIDFDLAVGELDADRYLPKSETKTASPAPASQAGPEPVIDLSPLQALDARGSLRVASLKIMNIKARDLRLQLKAAGGKAEVNPLTAVLYGGGVNGALSASAVAPQRLAAKLDLRGIQIGPLMKDALDQQPVDGRGNVMLNVSTIGNTVSQFKQGLNGAIGLQLQDGAVNGINIASALRNAKARLTGGAQEGTTGAQEKTDFTELSASFKIANGVAHNDDLSAKTPLLRLGGNGDIFLAEDRLDYTVKATVVPTLQGQGGPELEQLKGLTLPVRLSGPYTAIGWKIDFGGLATSRAQQLLQERQTQIREETQKRLDEEKAKAQQRLKEQAEERLKGLLGR